MRRWLSGCLLPIAVVVLAIIGFIMMGQLRQPPEEVSTAPPLIAINVAEAQQQHVRYQVSSQGTVEPKTQTSLVAEVSGRIILVDEAFRAGTLVHKGDVLARIDPADYKTAVAQAEANVAESAAALAQERAQGEVAARDWATIDPKKVTDIALRKPQLASAQAALNYAKAALAKARRDLQRTEIRAPYDGLVRTRDIAMGQYVSIGAALGQIDNTAIAELKLPVSDRELNWLGLATGEVDGTDIDVEYEVAGERYHWPATLIQSSGTLDNQSRMSFLIAEIADPYQQQQATPQPWLKFGTFVNAVITAGKQRSLLVIPKDAVRGDQVVVVDANNHIHHVTVDIDRIDDRFAYVRSGLSDGMRVSLVPLVNVVDGTEVAINKETIAEDGAHLTAEQQSQVARHE